MAELQRLNKAQTMFVTDEGLLNYLFLFPGQAQDPYTQRGQAPQGPATRKSYKAEWAGIVTPESQLAQVISLVAWNNDQSVDEVYDQWGRRTGQTKPGWHKHVFGQEGRIKMLHETKRDRSKCPYYEGKHILTLSQAYNAAKLLELQPHQVNLSDPNQMAVFQQKLNAKAPGAKRYANVGNQSDLQRIEEMQRHRMMNQLPPIPETEYRSVLLPVGPEEIWSGCFGRLCGHAYWNPKGMPATVHLALDFVLLTRQGDRLGGAQVSPDQMFAPYAPPAELAPPGMQALMQAQPWGQQFPQAPAAYSPQFQQAPQWPPSATPDWSNVR